VDCGVLGGVRRSDDNDPLCLTCYEARQAADVERAVFEAENKREGDYGFLPRVQVGALLTVLAMRGV
jgi:hypothetical protein